MITTKEVTQELLCPMCANSLAKGASTEKPQSVAYVNVEAVGDAFCCSQECAERFEAHCNRVGPPVKTP